MFSRHSSMTVGLVLVLTAVVLALPACGKKKDTGSTDNPAPNPGPMPGQGPGQTPTPGGDSSWLKPGLGLSKSGRDFKISQNNLKQIALAFHNYESVKGFLPNGILGPDGKTLGLSWRVLILPYVEENNLFLQFKLNEPWDSENNKKLIEKMPKLYAVPGGNSPAGTTYYRAFSGVGTVMPLPSSPGSPGTPFHALRLLNIPDGTSNTLFCAEAGDPVVWTKPDELAFTAKGPLPKLGGVFAGGANVAYADGRVGFIPESTPVATVRALITTSGGELVTPP